jgi:hypothetical protein
MATHFESFEPESTRSEASNVIADMHTIVVVPIAPMGDGELGIQEASKSESVDHNLVQQMMRLEQGVAPIDENASGSALRSQLKRRVDPENVGAHEASE